MPARTRNASTATAKRRAADGIAAVMSRGEHERVLPEPCSPPGLVFEVELMLPAAEALAAESWLGDYLQEMLQLPAFAAGRVYIPDAPAADAQREPGDTVALRRAPLQRVAQFTVADRQAFDRALAEDIDRLHTALRNRWGDELQLSARLLSGGNDQYSAHAPRCLNCEAVLTGQYCWRCGQRAKARMITVGELLSNLTTDLVQLESRLWRSLIPLITRPGQLTADYLAGRRVRYMPPFRMYLVFSLIFFLLVTLGTRGQDIVAFNIGQADSQTTPSERAQDMCRIDADFRIEPQWLADRLSMELLERRCLRIVSNPEGFVRGLIDALPFSLLLTLPLLALVMKLLYLFTGRYYAEHLLFFVHYHAFLFGFVILLLGALKLIEWTALPTGMGSALAFSGWLYTLYYPYRAMRRVYQQGRVFTLIKLALLLFAYTLCLLVVTLGTALFTAMTV